MWDGYLLMNNLPVVSRETAVSVVTPVIPLNFVYPGLSLAQILSIIRAYRKLSLLILLAVLSAHGGGHGAVAANLHGHGDADGELRGQRPVERQGTAGRSGGQLHRRRRWS